MVFYFNCYTKFILKILIRKMMDFVFWRDLKHKYHTKGGRLFFQLKPGPARLPPADRPAWPSQRQTGLPGQANGRQAQKVHFNEENTILAAVFCVRDCSGYPTVRPQAERGV